MYPEYTVHASGYNPRPARKNRLRNRFYHKFKYYPDLYNMFGCTGCGRCIRHCPVNIDIINIINGITEVAVEGEN
jgi:ferredoxin